MLRYELIENTDEFVSYRYFPEGEALFGTLTVRKRDKDVIEQKVAPNDDFKWCFWKLLNRIEEFIDNSHFEEKGIIAWY